MTLLRKGKLHSILEIFFSGLVKNLTWDIIAIWNYSDLKLYTEYLKMNLMRTFWVHIYVQVHMHTYAYSKGKMGEN